MMIFTDGGAHFWTVASARTLALALATALAEALALAVACCMVSTGVLPGLRIAQAQVFAFTSLVTSPNKCSG